MDNGTALSLRASTPDRIAAGRIDHAVALSRHTAQPFSGLLLADGRGDTHLSVVWCNVQGDAEVTGTGRRAQLSGRSADGPQSRRHVWQSTATTGTQASRGRAQQQPAGRHGAGYLQTFRANAEAWAKHVTLATAPPGAADDDPKARKGRREWEAVRRFVRDYCQGSCARTVTMTADLRQVIWVFIRNITGRPRAVSRQAGRPRPRALTP